MGLPVYFGDLDVFDETCAGFEQGSSCAGASGQGRWWAKGRLGKDEGDCGKAGSKATVKLGNLVTVATITNGNDINRITQTSISVMPITSGN